MSRIRSPVWVSVRLHKFYKFCKARLELFTSCKVPWCDKISVKPGFWVKN